MKILSLAAIILAASYALAFCGVPSANAQNGYDSHEMACYANVAESCDQAAWEYDQIAKAGGKEGMTRDYAFERKLFFAERGCKNGGQYSCDALGWAHEYGAETATKDPLKACRYYQQGCENGASLSCSNLGGCYYFGFGFAQDQARGLGYFEKACSMGYEYGCERAGIARTEMGITLEDVPAQYVNYNSLSAEELKSLCFEKDIEACQIYYDQIRATASDSYFIAEWICDHGNNAAYCNTAADALYSGAAPVLRDPNRAFQNYSMACYKGHAPACFQAGNMALAGDGIARDIFTAQPLFYEACRARISNSCQLADRLSGLMARGEQSMDDMTVRRAMEQGQSNNGLEGCTLVRLPNYRDYYNCTERDSKRMAR